MTRPPYGPPPGHGAPQWASAPGYGHPYGAPPGHGAPVPHARPYGVPLPPPPPYGAPGVRPYGPPVPYGYPRPPRRSGGGGLAAVFAVFGVFVVVGLLVLAGLAVAPSQSSASGTGPTPSFTYSPTTTPSTTAPTTTATTSGYSTTARSTTATRPVGPQPVLALGEHPLFSDSSLGLVNARCALTQFSLTPSVAKSFFDSAAACLDQM